MVLTRFGWILKIPEITINVCFVTDFWKAFFKYYSLMHPSTAFGHSDRKKRALTGRHNFVTSIL
jgi:hypothetical protein